MRSWFSVLTAIAAFSAGASFGSARPLVIGIAGDSTVATYPDSTPQKGWGQFIQPYFDDGVRVENLAKGGRSTKTFLGEGLWDELLAKKPDIVLIQFGHNDSHTPDLPEHTDAEGNYKTILTRFVADVRAAGAEPILITPVQRRTPKDNLIPYANAMIEVATARKVKLIDLHTLSGQLYARLGKDGTAALEKPDDRTHFNAEGARRIAGLVLQELLAAEPQLRVHLKDQK
jgi:lysophospholipase L1-like esterase